MMRRTLALTLAFAVLVCGEATAEKVETLRGYAEWTRGSTLIVDGQQVSVGPDTTLKGLARHGVESIEPGTEIVVKGVRDPDGRIRAREIEARVNGASVMERAIIGLANSVEQQWLTAGHVPADDDSGSLSLGRIDDRGPEVERVGRVLGRVLPPYEDRGRYRVYVVDNEEWNAMAMANGSIWVFRGLLDAVDEDELAIVVGHELAHVTHEHTRREVKRSLWLQGAATVALAAAEQVDHAGWRTTLQIGAGLSALGFVNRFSRDHEHQADRIGLRYAFEGGYDVSKAPGLWARFREKHGENPRLINTVFGSHPLHADRMTRLRQQIEWNYREPARPERRAPG